MATDYVDEQVKEFFKNIFFVAPQGAGKGTHLPFLEEWTGARGIGSGNILRDYAKGDTKDAKIVHDYMYAKKELVPAKYFLPAVIDTLEKSLLGQYLICDGVPRDIEQYNALSKYLTTLIHLDVPDDVCIERGLGRANDKKTGNIFNFRLRPEEVVDLVLDCDGNFVSGYNGFVDNPYNNPLFVRDDDTREGLAKRLNIYHASTEPIIDLHANNGGIVVSVNANLETSELVRHELYRNLFQAYNQRA